MTFAAVQISGTSPVARNACAIANDDARCGVADSTLAVNAIGLGKTIDTRAVLDDITFAIQAGEFIALLGANGAGKSTLLKTLATLITPTRGELRLFSQSLTNSSRRLNELRRRIGLIGHGAMLYRDLSPRENLEFFGKLYGVANPARRATELLDWIGLSHRANDAVKTFSRGMAQRVAIARALMHEPQLLLADEPFAGLDAPSAHMLIRMLQQLHESGQTIVLASHDLDQSLSLAQRVLVLRQGRLVVDQATSQLDEASLLREVSAS